MQQLSCSSGSLFTVTMLKGNFIIFPGLLLGSDQKVVRLRLLAIGTGENDPLVGRNPRVNVVGPIKSWDVRGKEKTVVPEFLTRRGRFFKKLPPARMWNSLAAGVGYRRQSLFWCYSSTHEQHGRFFCWREIHISGLLPVIMSGMSCARNYNM